MSEEWALGLSDPHLRATCKSLGLRNFETMNRNEMIANCRFSKMSKDDHNLKRKCSKPQERGNVDSLDRCLSVETVTDRVGNIAYENAALFCNAVNEKYPAYEGTGITNCESGYIKDNVTGCCTTSIFSSDLTTCTTKLAQSKQHPRNDLFDDYIPIHRISQSTVIVEREGKQFVLSMFDNRKKGDQAVLSTCAVSALTGFPNVEEFGSLYPAHDPKNLYSFVVTELISNAQPLSDVDIRALSWKAKLSLLFSILYSLKLAHDKLGDFVHGSLHPAHIYVSRNYVEKVVKYQGKAYYVKCPHVQLIHLVESSMPGYVQVQKRLALSFPYSVLVILSKYIGFDGAFMISNEVRKINNPDLRIWNAYAMLLGIMQMWHSSRDPNDENVPDVDFIKNGVKYYMQKFSCDEVGTCIMSTLFDDLLVDKDTPQNAIVDLLPKPNDTKHMEMYHGEDRDIPVQDFKILPHLILYNVLQAFSSLGFPYGYPFIADAALKVATTLNYSYIEKYNQHVSPDNVIVEIDVPLREGVLSLNTEYANQLLWTLEIPKNHNMLVRIDIPSKRVVTNFQPFGGLRTSVIEFDLNTNTIASAGKGLIGTIFNRENSLYLIKSVVNPSIKKVTMWLEIYGGYIDLINKSSELDIGVAIDLQENEARDIIVKHIKTLLMKPANIGEEVVVPILSAIFPGSTAIVKYLAEQGGIDMPFATMSLLAYSPDGVDIVDGGTTEFTFGGVVKSEQLTLDDLEEVNRILAMKNKKHSSLARYIQNRQNADFTNKMLEKIKTGIARLKNL